MPIFKEDPETGETTGEAYGFSEWLQEIIDIAVVSDKKEIMRL